MNFKKNLLNICICLTLLFWYFFYKFTTTEYDENANNLAYAVLTSFLTLGLFIYYSNKVDLSSKTENLKKIVVVVLGTPFTLILIILYFVTFKMNYASTEYHTNENKSYEVVKFRNKFYAKNTLIINNLTVKQDTIYAEVNKKGTNIEIYKISNAKKVKFKLENVKTILTTKQIKELTKY